MSKVQAISKDNGIEFGIKKSGMLVLKRGKLIKSLGIKLNDEEEIKEILEECYRYLQVTESEKIKEQKMTENFQKEYLRRTHFVLQSKLNGRSKTKVISNGAVSLMRFGGAITAWKMDERKLLDSCAFNLMTMNREFNRESDFSRVYVRKRESERGLVSTESCIRAVKNFIV